MLRLTPFHETASFLEAQKEDRIETLVGMIEVKLAILLKWQRILQQIWHSWIQTY